jgi:hypothetical protein
MIEKRSSGKVHFWKTLRELFFLFMIVLTGWMVGGYLFANYGGNNGCWALVDRLTRLSGYESCGLFGGGMGGVLGVIVWFTLYKNCSSVHEDKADRK